MSTGGKGSKGSSHQALHTRLFALPIDGDHECDWTEWQCTIPPSLQLADGTRLCSMHASMYADSSEEAKQAVLVALVALEQQLLEITHIGQIIALNLMADGTTCLDVEAEIGGVSQVLHLPGRLGE